MRQINRPRVYVLNPLNSPNPLEIQPGRPAPKRGDLVKTFGGGIGYFVGTRNDVDFIAYDVRKFDAQCRSFDASSIRAGFDFANKS